ncbi:MAG: acyltransferase [Candidatus Nomurabacteria bacterium]|jgi:hypothetical protein|nr:acyltransferase [Candidatus Nomurabacteria bacterium]
MQLLASIRSRFVKRSVPIEALRILAMFGIVYFHAFDWTYWGGVAFNAKYQAFMQASMVFGQLGNWLFLCIGCYFMTKLDFTSIKKTVLKIWRPTLFYSVTIFLFAALILKITPITLITVLQSVFPIVFSNYWFITSYITLILLAPLLSKMLSHLNKKQFKYLLAVGFFFLVIFNINPLFETYNEVRAVIPMFLYAFMVMFYVRKYKPKVANWKLVAIILGYFALDLALSCLYAKFGGIEITKIAPIHEATNVVTTVWNYAYVSELLVPVPAIAALLFVLNITGRQSKQAPKKSIFGVGVNIVASSMLGVYLIHANLNILGYIYNDIFNVAQYYGTRFGYLYPFIVAVTILVACVLIDITRRVFAYWFKILVGRYRCTR